MLLKYNGSVFAKLLLGNGTMETTRQVYQLGFEKRQFVSDSYRIKIQTANSITFEIYSRFSIEVLKELIYLCSKGDFRDRFGQGSIT